MFKPIKQHFKECQLDIHTSTKYGDAFINNPYIDNLIIHHANNKKDALHLCLTIPDMLKKSNYNKILSPHPMYNPDQWISSRYPEWGDNLIFAWVSALEQLQVDYSIPLETVLNLTDEEVQRARNYMDRTPNFYKKQNILIEIHGESGQTFWNENWTTRVGEYLVQNNMNLHISHAQLRGDIANLRDKYSNNIYWAGALTIRECAELFNHCYAFISVSSGLSNACNTNWCRKDIKWFEVVNSLACSSAAIRKEGKIFWHQNDVNAFIKMLDDKLLDK
jgi:ADP-heptose:LPS heptosyltransferase